MSEPTDEARACPGIEDYSISTHESLNGVERDLPDIVHCQGCREIVPIMRERDNWRENAMMQKERYQNADLRAMQAEERARRAEEMAQPCICGAPVAEEYDDGKPVMCEYHRAILGERRWKEIADDAREAMDHAKAAIWDAHYGKGLAIEYVHAVDAKLSAALARYEAAKAGK